MIFSAFGLALLGLSFATVISETGVGVRPPELPVEDGVAAQRRRVGDVELAVLAVVGMERDPQEPTLVEEGVKLRELRLDVQERLGQEPPARIDDPHHAVLLDHRLAAAAVGDRDHRQWVGEPAGDFLQFDFHLGIRRGGDEHRGGGCHKGRNADFLPYRHSPDEPNGSWIRLAFDTRTANPNPQAGARATGIRSRIG
jgi:hypothetical protein